MTSDMFASIAAIGVALLGLCFNVYIFVTNRAGRTREEVQTLQIEVARLGERAHASDRHDESTRRDLEDIQRNMVRRDEVGQRFDAISQRLDDVGQLLRDLLTKIANV